MARTVRVLAMVAVALLPLVARAQAPEPPRPQLPVGSDPRFWEPYFDVGVRVFKQTPISAAGAFYWASKLDPTRAEPLFARYAAFFAHTKQEDVLSYFRAQESILTRPDILKADSLRLLALMRNPFVHRGLEILIFDRMPGSFSDDRDTRAWIAYSNGEFSKAVDLLTRTIERQGRRSRWKRFDRALAYAAMGDAKNALVDLRALLDELRAEDEKGALTIYTSKHFVLYMIGMLHTSMRDYASARTAFQESLLEDAAFAYGNAGLAAISRIQRNNAQAADEYALAVDLAPQDGVLRFWRAQVLFDLQRWADAERELAVARTLEPYWPAPHFLHGRLLEKLGKETEAFEAYAKFVALAPANDTPANAIRARIAARAQRSP
jgi:tetratricopeptide (TPR) repeat protein